MAAIGFTPSGAVVAEQIRDLQCWMGQGSSRLLRLVLLRYQRRQPIEGAHHLANDVGRDLRVACGRIQLRVPQQHLAHFIHDVV